MFFQVQGTIVCRKQEKNGYVSTTRQIPTFYLKSNVQGIMSLEHAMKIAKEIVSPVGDENFQVNLSVIRCD